MARISIRVEGLEEVNRLFARLRRAGDLAPALRNIGEYILKTTRERFTDTQAAPDGTPWATLDPRTVRRKKKNADKILIEDETLSGTGLVYQEGPDEVSVGSSLKYAATHQFGDTSRNIPARPFLGLSAADRAEIERIARDRLAKALRG